MAGKITNESTIAFQSKDHKLELLYTLENIHSEFESCILAIDCPYSDSLVIKKLFRHAETEVFDNSMFLVDQKARWGTLTMKGMGVQVI